MPRAGGQAMTRGVSGALLALGVAIGLAACQPRRSVEPATLIVHNARVYTVDRAQPTVEAIAARGDRIVLVGTNRASITRVDGPRSSSAARLVPTRTMRSPRAAMASTVGCARSTV